MKDTILVILAALLIVTNLENLLLDQEIEKQAERYETRLEVQEMEYRDELIEIRQAIELGNSLIMIWQSIAWSS